MFRTYSHFHLLLLLFISSLMISCAQNTYPPEVRAALANAGENRAELEQVIATFVAADDTLKLQAAYFLIGNMEGHCLATYQLQDTAGNEIEFNVLDYPDYPALTASFDTLEENFGVLDFVKGEKIHDLETITADFLITQINYAFRAWREKPWARDFSFADFCRYILPYRGSNEPLEPWREIFWAKYQNIDTNMADPTDPIEAAQIINDDVMTWFGFDPRFYYHPTDLGISEMQEIGLGRCEDMTNATIYAMRAVGLAVTSDYTPHWANSGNNHAWNAIVTPDGNVTPFMGAECNPGRYKLANKLAKVYRKSFGNQKDNLIFQERKQEKVPAWLAGKSYLDVTADYVDVCEVTVTFDRGIPDSVDLAYLCVFNSGEWRPIHWARIVGDSAVFTDMGADIAYLPALYLNEEIVPYGMPFILYPDCAMETLTPAEQTPLTVHLNSTTARKQEPSTDGIAKTFLKRDRDYELFYWAGDDWMSMGALVAGAQPLTFINIPAGALYWLVEVGSDHEERIFTIADGRQVWW
ncbi:transglutaminase-like domain-containing protein [Candidatus Zixiibacteriota bacterium]